MAQIKNLTPHPIHLVDEDNKIIRIFAPEGLVRLKSTTVEVGQIDGCKITTTQFGEPEGLPKEHRVETGQFVCENCYDIFPSITHNGLCPHIDFCGGNLYPSTRIETYYLVSQLVKSALPSRKDLLVPAEIVRDKDGNIIGCRSFGS
jgi:hypothetical protein